MITMKLKSTLGNVSLFKEKIVPEISKQQPTLLVVIDNLRYEVDEIEDGESVTDAMEDAVEFEVA